MKQNTIQTAWGRNACSPVPSRRALLVDGDAPTRNLLTKALQEWSFTTSTAATFREAQQVVLTEPPFTVIVCDDQLPDGDGLEFLDWLRREMLVRVPFLLISAGVPRAPSALVEYEFLTKPFRLQELRTRLEKLSRANRRTAAAFHLTIAQEAMASVYARCRPPKDK